MKKFVMMHSHMNVKRNAISILRVAKLICLGTVSAHKYKEESKADQMLAALSS
jgi:hypothetical protein